jgi:hypothetical protein
LFFFSILVPVPVCKIYALQEYRNVFLSLQAAPALKELAIMWDELQEMFPSEFQMITLEELAAALRPLQLLTKNICSSYFNVLQADTIFKTATKALQSQQTSIADQLLEELESRYNQRKNNDLLSAIRFLSDPMGYDETDSGLHFCEIEDVLKKLYSRLFPGITSETEECHKEATVASETASEAEVSYAERLAALFEADLQNIRVSKGKKTSDIAADCQSAKATGELTVKLKKLLDALLSVPASSVEAERAFSTAGRFVTKIRNRLGDKTLDSYCFAKHKFQMERQLVIIHAAFNTHIILISSKVLLICIDILEY